MLEQIVEDVACTVCACICDDLKVTVRDGQITSAERACSLAEPWFRGEWHSSAPPVQIKGQAATLQQGIDEAAKILRDARAPLIFGLSKSSTEGQRAAVALADKLGATIDTTASEGHAPSILALQQVGESTCSLGEIRNRADLVIYWGADPRVSHPRHMERYSLEPTGLMIPNGRTDRRLIVVDSQRTQTAAEADWFLQIAEGRDFDALWILRGLFQGVEPNAGEVPEALVQDLKRLAEMMKNCRCGIIFFGYGVAQHPMGHRNVEALLRLVIDLNQFTRFHARRLRNVGDVSGADSVLCWQTGYPFSVNLARGYPRYNPDEYSADDVLSNKEADVLVLVGTTSVSRFSKAAQDYLRTIPTIVLERVNAELEFVPTVHFTTATYGIHRSGTAYRMDEIPVRLRPLIDSNLPTDGDVLRAIQGALV